MVDSAPALPLSLAIPALVTVAVAGDTNFEKVSFSATSAFGDIREKPRWNKRLPPSGAT
jgi:hypothetical protein